MYSMMSMSLFEKRFAKMDDLISIVYLSNPLLHYMHIRRLKLYSTHTHTMTHLTEHNLTKSLMSLTMQTG